MSTPSSLDQVQTQAFEYVRQGQEVLTRMAGAATEGWAAVLRGAATPAGAGGARPASAFAALPTAFGRPADVVDRSFDLGVQILEAQRALAHGLLDAAAPALRVAESAAESVAGSTSRGH